MGLILTILGESWGKREAITPQFEFTNTKHMTLTVTRWPWALTEGALEAGWAPTDTEYHWDDLLRILTGEEVELKDTEDIDSETTCEPFTAVDQ